MKFRLFIGGIENVNKESAIWMATTDEEDLTRQPKWPKILYAVGIPLVWFWGTEYEELDGEPELPNALNKDFFTIIYDYAEEELNKIVADIIAENNEI